MLLLKRSRNLFVILLVVFAIGSCAGSGDDAADSTNPDESAIQAVWDKFGELYATQKPSNAEIENFFSTYVADDYRDRGAKREQEKARWQSEEGPPIGMTLQASIAKEMSSTEYNSNYQKGYWLNIAGKVQNDTFQFKTSMVKTEQGQWLWFGDREYVEFEPEIYANKIERASNINYDTGIFFDIRDRSNYSLTNWGIQSAVVTGPGLPADGLKLARMDTSEDDFLYWRDYGSGVWRWEWENHLSDASIDTIPLNPTYSLTLCKDNSTDILNGCDPANIVETKTINFQGKPLTSAEVQNNDLFPSITVPSATGVSDFPWSDSINIQWNNASNGEVYGVEFRAEGNLGSRVDYQQLYNRETSVTFDTSSWTIGTLNEIQIYMKHSDSKNHKFRLFKRYW